MWCDEIRWLNIMTPKPFILWVNCSWEQYEFKVAGLFMYRSSRGPRVHVSFGRLNCSCSLTFYATIGNIFVVPRLINSFFSPLMNIISVTHHIRPTLTPPWLNAGTHRCGCKFSYLTSSWIYNQSDPSKRIVMALELSDIKMSLHVAFAWIKMEFPMISVAYIH